MGECSMHETKEILEGPQSPCPDLLVMGQEKESLPCLGKMRTVTGQDGSPTPADLPDIPAQLHRAQRRSRPCDLDARCVCLSPDAKRARGRLSLGQEPCRDTPRVSEEPWYGL